jgi:hypothetical protein
VGELEILVEVGLIVECLLQALCLSRSMNGENRPLDTNEPVAFEN